MVWWHWMVLGLFLTALELVAPGSFFIIFFGVAALIVGLLDFMWTGRAGLGPVAAVRDHLGRRAPLLPQSAAAPGTGSNDPEPAPSTR